MFDSEHAQPFYEDIGIDTTLIGRPDMTAPTAADRKKLVPETVGVANIDDFNASSINDIIGRDHPQFKLLDDEGLFRFSEPQNAFECGWAVLKQGGV